MNLIATDYDCTTSIIRTARAMTARARTVFAKITIIRATFNSKCAMTNKTRTMIKHAYYDSF